MERVTKRKRDHPHVNTGRHYLARYVREEDPFNTERTVDYDIMHNLSNIEDLAVRTSCDLKGLITEAKELFDDQTDAVEEYERMEKRYRKDIPVVANALRQLKTEMDKPVIDTVVTQKLLLDALQVVEDLAEDD